MGLNTPVVPPFPISDYGTGCMGAIAALTGLYHRAETGGSYRCKCSLMHYDLLLFAVGQYPPDLQEELRNEQLPEFINLRHHDSVDRISATTLDMLQKRFPDLLSVVVVDDGGGCSLNPEEWFSSKHNAEIEIVKPETQIQGGGEWVCTRESTKWKRPAKLGWVLSRRS